MAVWTIWIKRDKKGKAKARTKAHLRDPDNFERGLCGTQPKGGPRSYVEVCRPHAFVEDLTLSIVAGKCLACHRIEASRNFRP